MGIPSYFSQIVKRHGYILKEMSYLSHVNNLYMDCNSLIYDAVKNNPTYDKGKAQEYEKQHFGEIYTDLSNSEKVVNMWVYIEGERVLQKSKTLNKNWDKKLYSLDINKIIKELQA